MYLENIYSPADVKKLSFQELNDLSNEIRASLLQKLSEHGGHFGPNFGMVEATIALHYVFNSPEDKIVFDVSHQSYVHKMLTGRKDAFLYPADHKCAAFRSRLSLSVAGRNKLNVTGLASNSVPSCASNCKAPLFSSTVKVILPDVSGR